MLTLLEVEERLTRGAGGRRNQICSGCAHDSAPDASAGGSRPWPIQVTLKAVRKIASPGQTTSQGARSRNGCASAIIAAQSGVGGCTPRPMNDSPPTVINLWPKRRNDIAAIGRIAFGMMWRKMMKAARAAEDFGGADVVTTVDLEREAAREPGERRPADDGQRQDERADAGAENCREKHGDDDIGKRDQQIDGAHGDFVHLPADARADDADDVPMTQDRTSVTAAITRAKRPPISSRLSNVAAEMIGAEPVLRGRCRETPQQALRGGIVRRPAAALAENRDDRREEHEPDPERPAVMPVDEAAKQGLLRRMQPQDWRGDSLIRWRGHTSPSD